MTSGARVWEWLAAAAKVQTVASVGQPDDLGARIVDGYADDLRRLSDA